MTKYTKIDEGSVRQGFYEDRLRAAESQHLSATLELEYAQGLGNESEIPQLEERVATSKKQLDAVRKLVPAEES